jgi:hypothetical protein
MHLELNNDTIELYSKIHTTPPLRVGEESSLFKAPKILNIDTSMLVEAMQPILEQVKIVQSIIDEQYTPEKILSELNNKDIVYQTSNHYVKINLLKTGTKKGYFFAHQVTDNLDIVDTVASTLGITKEDIYYYNLFKTFDIIHVKPNVVYPYHTHRPVDSTILSDPVDLAVWLSGSIDFHFETLYRANKESFSANMKNNVIAFNPRLLHTGTTSENDAYLLAIMSTSLTFDNLISKQNEIIV